VARRAARLSVGTHDVGPTSPRAPVRQVDECASTLSVPILQWSYGAVDSLDQMIERQEIILPQIAPQLVPHHPFERRGR
jgi:hypothetical protein